MHCGADWVSDNVLGASLPHRAVGSQFRIPSLTPNRLDSSVLRGAMDGGSCESCPDSPPRTDWRRSRATRSTFGVYLLISRS